MRLHYFVIVLTGLTLTTMLSCGDSSGSSSLSSAKSITSFVINGIAGTIDQSTKTILLEIAETDLSSLTPFITFSEKASISPAARVPQDFTNPVTYTVTAEDGSTESYTVTVSSSIISFSFNGKDYEIVKSNMTWIDAATIAARRNGVLAEINDADEQEAIFSALTNASITTSNTVAPDGGGASYIWIGGNDLATEGEWIWDGDNNQTGDQFWMGLQNGSPVGDLYNNWGNEPDNFGSGQDGLGLALTDWPLGDAGQWNDVSHTNTLYFLIELN